jgi:putative membrane protein
MTDIKNAKKGVALTTWVNLFIIGLFTAFFLIKGNYEFLFYAFTLGIVCFIIERTDRIFTYPPLAKIGFNLWVFLHFSGGAFNIAGTKLYDTVLISIIGEPFNLLKYDQVIHGYCYFVITLFMYSVVLYISDRQAPIFLVSLITVLAGASIGAINEIIEFASVVFLDAGQAVGGYYNNALDLVFNFIGAVIAVIIVVRRNPQKPIP